MRFENARLKLERERSLADAEARKRELQLQRDQAKLEAEISEYSGSDEDEGGGIMEALEVLNRLNTPRGGGNQTSQGLSSPPNPPPELSDDEIMQLLSNLPKAAKKAIKKLPDQTLLKMAQAQLPGYSTNTYIRALHLARTRL